jgi:hypothetical protein
LRFQRASASAAVASRLLEVYYDTDIRVLLPAIRARAAVLKLSLGQAYASYRARARANPPSFGVVSAEHRNEEEKTT